MLCSVSKLCPTLCNLMDCKSSHYFIVAVQSLTRVPLFATLWTAACQVSLFFTILWSLLKFMSTESVMLYSRLILCLPFSSCPQSFPASVSFLRSRLFASGGQSIAASASVLPMNIQSLFSLGLASFISWQSTGLSRVFNTTVLRHSAFLMVQVSHLYVTTGKTISLTIQTFGSKVMSLFFNTLS